MKTPAGFARYAGHDPMEKEIGWAASPCSETAKAIIRSGDVSLIARTVA